jgi:hypothetical protein
MANTAGETHSLAAFISASKDDVGSFYLSYIHMDMEYYANTSKQIARSLG